MQNLEKILEEIDREIEERRKDPEMRDVDICYGLNRAKEIIRRHMNDGWIPVEERLPEEPKETPEFDNKPLGLYLVDIGGSYPLRAFWNGKQFTDGWSILKVIAWMPLPEPYTPKKGAEECQNEES